MAYLYSDVEVYVHVLSGEGKWLRGVDCHDLMCVNIVGWAGRHLEYIVVRHVCGMWNNGSRYMTASIAFSACAGLSTIFFACDCGTRKIHILVSFFSQF